MKTLYTLLAVLLTAPITFSQCNDLFFAEYLEGSSNNKAIELYNPTCNAVDLTDYVIYRYNAGSPTPSDSLFPEGMLSAHTVFVIGNPLAIAQIVNASDTTHIITYFGGDDALSLNKISTGDTLDIIGQVGIDPGSSWPVGTGATGEFTLVRKINIQAGQTNWAIGSTEWEVFPQDMTDSLGVHTMTFCAATGTDTRTECSPYTWIDGNDYTSNNSSATFNIVGGAINGCDSLVTLNLTITSVSDLTTTTSGATISANNASATYQWLDCDNNYATISSATNQSFTATANGNYAVELTENGCADTSACVAITSAGFIENNFGHELVVYPNPTEGNFAIDLGSQYETTLVSIYDVKGDLIQSRSFNQSQLLQLAIQEPSGIYLITIQSGDKKASVQLIKE